MSKYTSFYRLTIKGELEYSDYFEVHEKNKFLVIIYDLNRTDVRLKESKKIPAQIFDKKIKAFKKKDYKISYESPDFFTSEYDEVIRGLQLHFPLEKLIPLSSHRPSKGNYYDLNLIVNALDSYIEHRISYLYLSYWINLFSYAVQESFDSKMTKENVFQFSIIKILYDLKIFADKCHDEDSLYNEAKSIKEMIVLTDKKYREKEVKKNKND